MIKVYIHNNFSNQIFVNSMYVGEIYDHWKNKGDFDLI